MLWYIIICALMAYPLLIVYLGSRTGKKTDAAALFFGCLILWFFMAMRDVSVGVDTQHYAFVFQQFPDIPLSKVFTAVTYATPSRKWVYDFEPGYRLLNKLLSYFFTDPQAIIIVNSTIIMFLLYRLIQRHSANYMLSLWLYLTLGIFQTEMNVSRNAIAIFIVYNGFDYIAKGKLPQYLLCCITGALFHVTALVFIPFYWILRIYKPTFRKSLLIIGIFAVAGAMFPVLSPVIRMLLPGSLQKYFDSANDKLASLMVGAVHAVLFIMVYWMLDKKNRASIFRKYRVGIVLLTMNLCFFGLNIGLDSAARMAALFGPYIIILIPQMITQLDSRVKRRNAVIVVAGMSFVQFILRMSVNNIGGSMPYRFFW